MSKRTKDGNVVRGSGDVFADLGFADAPVMRMKSRVANEIARALGRQKAPVSAVVKAAGRRPQTYLAFATPIWTASPLTGWFVSPSD